MPARNGPPPIRSILHRELEPDPLYRIGVLSGPEGTWHRLWSAMVVEASGLAAGAEFVVETLHDELAEQVGRPLLSSEFEALRVHASQRGERLLALMVKRALSDRTMDG